MKKKLFISIAVIGVIALLIGINFAKNNGAITFSKGKGVEVQTTKASKSDISSFVSVNGTIEEVEKEEIYFDTPARVVDLYIKKDQKVKKGQKMVEFDLDSMNNQLRQARVNLNIQKINLEKIKDSFKLQNVAQLESALAQAKSSLEQAKSNFERIEKLYNKGSASFVEYDGAKTQYDNAQLQYNVAQNNLKDINETNQDLKRNNDKDIRNQEQQISLTELTISELESNISKLQSRSISPIDGVISELNIEKGSTVSPSMTSIVIIDPNNLRVNLEVKEVDALKVKVGQEVEITGDAFSDKRIMGEVVTVGAVAKEKQGTNNDQAFIEVLADINNDEGILKPGLSINAKILIKTNKNVIVVPFNTMQEDKDGKLWVYSVENGIAVQKNIKTGIMSEMNVEIIEGLQGNEEIIIDPPSRLRDGMPVIINKQKNE